MSVIDKIVTEWAFRCKKGYPDAEQSKKDIVMHIKRFWALNMRLQLIEHAQGSADGLEPLVKEAVLQHHALLA